MTDAETIAGLRALLAERDAEIRGLRGMLAEDIDAAKRVWDWPAKPPFAERASFLKPKPGKP
jgi:hypothetical protein